MPESYPLAWPEGWPRTEVRKPGQFSYKSRHPERGWINQTPITLGRALNRLKAEVDRMGAALVTVSTNLQVRLDGLPRSGQRAPDDPGVAVYIEVEGEQRCIPCDQYTKVEQNIAAVAATIEALRALDRHGSGLMNRAFRGFKSLPPPTDASETANGHWWRSVLQLTPEQWDNPAEITDQWLRLRSAAHPDRGGSNEAFDRMNKAYDAAKRELGEGRFL